MKAVFDTRGDTNYDDEISVRYHFPNRYLPAARAALGDWIVYREPRRGGGRQGYVAFARVVRITDDLTKAGHSYAHVEDYLPFDDAVPLQGREGFYELALANVADPMHRGRELRGKSVRIISDLEFATIIYAGLGETLNPANAIRLGLDASHLDTDTRSIAVAPPEERVRRVEQIMLNKAIRAAAFRRSVMDAYGGRCAVTRLRIVNGGGRVEAQAAHIVPVEDGGPDTVQNGIALSATVHWLFDRHLISLTDDYGLLVSHNRVPSELRSLFDGQFSRIHLPEHRKLWPLRSYIARHRERFASPRPDSEVGLY